MEFRDVVSKRYSCKKFDSARQVAPEALERILEAGRLARPDVPETEAIEALRQLIADDGLWRNNNSPRPATEPNK